MNLHHQHTHTWIKVLRHPLTIAKALSNLQSGSNCFAISTKKATWLPQKSTDRFFFCFFLQIIHSAVCFQLPRNCQRCFRKRHCQNLVPLVMNTGWQQGVNHGKDNALLEQAWFDSSRRMTLLDYYHVSSAALSCSFCSVSGALRGFSQWIPIDFFWSCHQIVCGLNRDYRFLICSLRFFSS